MSYEFKCQDAGAMSCWGSVSANSEDELRKELAEHVRNTHEVEPNATLLDHLVATAKQR